jgi:hypothetical protein
MRRAMSAGARKSFGDSFARKTVDQRACSERWKIYFLVVGGMPVYPARLTCPQGCPICITESCLETLRLQDVSSCSPSEPFDWRVSRAGDSRNCVSQVRA